MATVRDMTDTSLPTCTVAPGPVARSAREWQQQHPTWLYAGLLAGTVADRTSTSHERHEVAVDELGTVPLPDGRLVACDPYVGGAGAAPFRTLLPRGEHPAYLARTRITDDHWRVMAVVLATGPGPVSSWSMGRVGEEVLPTKAGEYTGFGVDAGTGCLASPLAMPDVAEVLDDDEGMLEDPLSVAVFESDLDAGVVAPRPGALPVAVFSSGWGDGVYPTWLGLAADGSVAVAMVDLMVLNDPFASPEDELETAAPSPGRGGFWTRLLGRR